MGNGHLHVVKQMYRTTLRRTVLKKRKFTEEIQKQTKGSYFKFKYPFIEICVVYEIMWKNVVDRDTENDYIIEHMRFTCCYIKLCAHR